MKRDCEAPPPAGAPRAAPSDPSTALRAAQGEEALAAMMSRISRAQDFAEGDPRRGPFTASEARKARDYLHAEDRKHATKDVDLFAVRLQYGRGVSRTHAAQMFGIADSVIGKRRKLAGKKKWIDAMSERDRRDLARHVWLGGLARRLIAGQEADAATLAALKAASEWTRIDDEKLAWLPQDETGEPATMKVYPEISDDDYDTERDPYRDERNALWARFEEELEALEADDDEDDSGEDDEEETGALAEAPGEADQARDAVEEDAALQASGRPAEDVAAVGE